MFLVIAENGKHYGPLTTEQVQDWLQKGWLTSKSKIKDEDQTDWKTIADHPSITQSHALPKTEKTPPPSIQHEEATPLETKPHSTNTFQKILQHIPMEIANWSTLAIASIFFGAISIFWKGILPIAAIILGHFAFFNIKKNSERKGRPLAIGGLALGYLTLAIIVFNLFTITIPSIREGEENLRRMKIIQDSIDQFGPTTQEYQCWNASGLKIPYVDGIILNSSETHRLINAILTLDSFKSANIPPKELTPKNLVLMRIGHIPGSYTWRVVCYRRNIKGYGVDRKGRSMKPEAFDELQENR